MSLVTQVSNLATRTGTEIKAVYAKQGNLTDLTTSSKSSLVSAINEIRAATASASGIDDTKSSTTSTYSSSKTDSQIANAVATKPSINDSAASGSAVYSSQKTDSQIASALAGKPSINDTTPSSTSVYSSSKTDNQISQAVANLVNGSPAALDTLKELSDALGGDSNFAATTSAALGNRLRFDAAQTLSAAQKTQGITNLGTVAATDIGDTTTDFVSIFVAALS